MDIFEESLGDNLYKVVLAGRMDFEGISSVETRFSGMTASPRKGVVVDLSAVPFMSSMGIRTLMLNAKAMANRGAKLVLFNPDSNVRSVLDNTGISQLIPTFDRLQDAVAALSQ